MSAKGHFEGHWGMSANQTFTVSIVLPGIKYSHVCTVLTIVFVYLSHLYLYIFHNCICMISIVLPCIKYSQVCTGKGETMKGQLETAVVSGKIGLLRQELLKWWCATISPRQSQILRFSHCPLSQYSLHHHQALTGIRYPTLPGLFLLPVPYPDFFWKFQGSGS